MLAHILNCVATTEAVQFSINEIEMNWHDDNDRVWYNQNDKWKWSADVIYVDSFTLLLNLWLDCIRRKAP